MTLAQQVARRQTFIEKAVAAIQDLLRKYGTVTSYSEHSAHTTISRELKDFGGLNFFSIEGRTMFDSGGHFTVSQIGHPGVSLLDVDFRTVEPIEVLHYDDSKWERLFWSVIRRADKIDAAKKKREETLVLRSKQASKRIQENARIQADAVRLGL